MTAATCVSPDTGSVPFQAGVQPPLPARMNAMSNALAPVAAMTGPRSGPA